MGDYTGLHIKGIVKQNFRHVFEDIALFGDWCDSDDKMFQAFGQKSRADFIPCGVLMGMDMGLKDGCERITYDVTSGAWEFRCNLKDDGIISEFFQMIPYFMDSVEIGEMCSEYQNWSTLWQLKDGVMTSVNANYKQYSNRSHDII